MANDCAERLKNTTCIDNFEIMVEQCAQTCKICSPHDPSPKTIATHGKGSAIRIFASEPQSIVGPTSIETWLLLRQTENYMYDIVYRLPEFEDVREECKNRHRHCTYWAAVGQCIDNEAYMITQCAPACQTCLMIKRENRCPFVETNEPTALSEPGELNAMFTRILTDPALAMYSPKALSQPNIDSNEGADNVPWVVQLDNFLSPEECDTFIQLATAQGKREKIEYHTVWYHHHISWAKTSLFGPKKLTNSNVLFLIAATY
jgi:prolyl 4-hydroxylase